jgi:hypothetical protein
VGQRFRVLILVLVLGGAGILLGSALAQWWHPASDPVVSAVGPLASERIKVQVLNGGGLEGVAWDATQALRDMGFDVVSYGNAGTFTQDSSVVMDRVGRLGTARLVAEAIGIERIRSEPDSSLYVDVTVVLGREWVRPTVLEINEEEIPWWDIRRFFRRGDSSTDGIATD